MRFRNCYALGTPQEAFRGVINRMCLEYATAGWEAPDEGFSLWPLCSQSPQAFAGPPRDCCTGDPSPQDRQEARCDARSLHQLAFWRARALFLKWGRSGCDICHPIDWQSWLGWSGWLGRCPLPPSLLHVHPSWSCALSQRGRPSPTEAYRCEGPREQVLWGAAEGTGVV